MLFFPLEKNYLRKNLTDDLSHKMHASKKTSEMMPAENLAPEAYAGKMIENFN